MTRLRCCVRNYSSALLLKRNYSSTLDPKILVTIYSSLKLARWKMDEASSINLIRQKQSKCRFAIARFPKPWSQICIPQGATDAWMVMQIRQSCKSWVEQKSITRSLRFVWSSEMIHSAIPQNVLYLTYRCPLPITQRLWILLWRPWVHFGLLYWLPTWWSIPCRIWASRGNYFCNWSSILAISTFLSFCLILFIDSILIRYIYPFHLLINSSSIHTNQLHLSFNSFWSTTSIIKYIPKSMAIQKW